MLTVAAWVGGLFLLLAFFFLVHLFLRAVGLLVIGVFLSVTSAYDWLGFTLANGIDAEGIFALLWILAILVGLLIDIKRLEERGLGW